MRDDRGVTATNLLIFLLALGIVVWAVWFRWENRDVIAEHTHEGDDHDHDHTHSPTPPPSTNGTTAPPAAASLWGRPPPNPR